MPSHMTVADLSAKIRHLERAKFVILDKGKHGDRPPIADGIEIEIEVTPPSAGHGIRLMFARAGEPDQALSQFCLDFGNHQWVREAGSHWR